MTQSQKVLYMCKCSSGSLVMKTLLHVTSQRRVGPEYVVRVRGATGVEEAGGEQATAAEGQAAGYTEEVTGAAA